ncbi:winged helix-turn-helix domain-containing protein [Streptomyces sp. NBC_00870]|uniref:winged helix-turn-helix domain-containing protein n=1 Tax=Streptomyces sp. NBC_00870 TaxID=2903685 RepID=UPI0038661B01
MIGRRFHLTYTVQGVRKLLVRNGWSFQVPARRAMECDDDVVAGWVKEVWPCAEDPRRPVGPGCGLRGRGRTLHDAAAGKDLAPARPDPVVRMSAYT